MHVGASSTPRHTDGEVGKINSSTIGNELQSSFRTRHKDGDVSMTNLNICGTDSRSTFGTHHKDGDVSTSNAKHIEVVIADDAPT